LFTHFCLCWSFLTNNSFNYFGSQWWMALLFSILGNSKSVMVFSHRTLRSSKSQCAGEFLLRAWSLLKSWTRRTLWPTFSISSVFPKSKMCPKVRVYLCFWGFLVYQIKQINNNCWKLRNLFFFKLLYMA